MKIIRLAIRSLFQFRLYTLINIIGLALSLACVIVIFKYIHSEWSTDHFNSRLDRIYISALYEKNKDILRFFTTENVLMRNNYVNPLDIPEIEKKTSFISLPDVNIIVDNKKFSAHVIATDTAFLQIMDYPLVQGNRNTALAAPTDAVVTRALASKLFGKENPIGKNITYNQQTLTIRGVIGDLSTQSSLMFDLLISKELQWRWPPVNYHSIALTLPGTDINKINERLKQTKSIYDFVKYYQLYPLSKLYINTSHDKGYKTFRQGNKYTLDILFIVGILILVVGIINFIHICSVIILKRSRELGMKKVFGARPKQLFIQLYIENLVLTFLALLSGWALIELTEKWQVRLFQITVTDNLPFNLLLSVSILFGLPLIITLYPFFRYNYHTAISSLQGVVPAKNKIGIRSVFLIMQYGITFCLIISALFFIKQLNFMLNTNPGYRTENIVKVWFQRPSSLMQYSEEEIEKIEKEKEYILETVKNSPLFTACCYGGSPYEFPINNSRIKVAGDKWQEITFITLPLDFFKLYGIPVTSKHLVLSANEVLMNHAARKSIHQTTDSHPIIEIERYGEIKSYIVKDFIADFQIQHLSRPISPLIIKIEESSLFNSDKLMASVVAGRKQEALNFLKELHSRTVGGNFEYSFVEDELHDLYKKDKQIATIYSVFALIAMLISSLGLFSISLFDIQQRYKEIALRKVNGASNGIIVRTLLNKYTMFLVIAFIIASPVTLLALHKYLENFAHKAPISWWLFIVAALTTAGISFCTLIFQIQHAATVNPAKILKSE